MADRDFELEVLGDLHEQAATMGQLARAEKSFIAAFEAFRSQDRKAFQAALRRPRLLRHCRLVCEWIRMKECLFRCVYLCGPPKPLREPPNPRVLAEAIVKLTSDERAVRELAQAVEKGDRAAFQRLVRRYRLGPVCHLFCHWVCYVRYRLVCRWLCEPDLPEPPDLVLELRAAGHALRALLDDRRAWDAAVSASDADDPEKLRQAIERAELIPLCRWICIFFCSWRCVLVCSRLCIRYPIEAIDDPLREALGFAKAARALAERPRELERLSAAVGAGDEKAFTGIVEELQLHRYRIQLCHWVCFLRCRRFCRLVCPPPGLYPWFTSIGGYEYLTDVDSTPPGTGLTVDNRAFYSTLRLNGILTQTLGGQPLEYRFEVRTTDASGTPVGGPTGTWSPVKPAQIAKTEIGKWQRWDPVNLTMETKSYVVGGPPGPNELAATIDANGWVRVPQESNVFSPQGAFFPNGNMINLVSPLVGDVFSPPSNPFPAQNEAATVAGGAPSHPLAQDRHFGIRMRIRQVGNPGSETNGGTCEHVAIDNILYDNIVRHPNWDGGPLPPGQLAVAMLNIQELLSAGCARITSSLNVLFTAGHPNLGAVTIEMTGPGGPYAFALPASGAGEWFGTATPSGWSVASLTPCAYIVTLSVEVLLTTGDSVPLPLQDQIAFCKS